MKKSNIFLSIVSGVMIALFVTLPCFSVELVRGITLSDGQQLYASDLHNLIDTATIGVGFYNDQQTVNSLNTGYYFLVEDPVNQVFRRVTAQTILYGNTNFWWNLTDRPNYSWNYLNFYDPTNGWIGRTTASNLFYQESSNINFAALRIANTNDAAMTNQWTLSSWPYPFLSGLNTNFPASMIVWDTNGIPWRIGLSNLEQSAAGDLGTNFYIPYQYTNTFLPWMAGWTNTYTNAWGYWTNFPITGLYMTNSAPTSTNTPTLVDGDTVPINSKQQSTNTTATLLSIYQYLTNKNALPAYALGRVQFIGSPTSVAVTGGSTLTYQFLASGHGMTGIKAVSWQFTGTASTTCPTTPQVAANTCYYALTVDSSHFVLFTNYSDAVNSNNPVHISGTVAATQNTLLYLNNYTAFNADAIQLCTGTALRTGYYDVYFRTNLTTANYYFTGSMMPTADTQTYSLSLSADNVVTTSHIRIYTWGGTAGGGIVPQRVEVLVQPE